MLPLGRRVQEKLEALIDKYMYQLGEVVILFLNRSANGKEAPPNWHYLQSRPKRYGLKVVV
jgi:hypothetical protein